MSPLSLKDLVKRCSWTSTVSWNIAWKLMSRSQSRPSEGNKKSCGKRYMSVALGSFFYPGSLCAVCLTAELVLREMGLITLLVDLTLWKLCFVTAVPGLFKVPRWTWDRQKLISHQPAAILKWLWFTLSFLFIFRSFMELNSRGNTK